MLRRLRRTAGVLGIVTLLTASTACLAYQQPGARRAAVPYGYGTPVPHDPTRWEPVTRDGASPSPDAQATRKASRRKTPRRPLPPRRQPATTVPQVTHQDPAKVVALTFDDGPGEYTDDVVRVLRREQVPATFFVLGKNVTERPDEVRDLVRAGMSVQSHTWDHEDLTALSSRSIDVELRRTDRAVERTAGVRPRCVRPPFGATDGRVERRIARAGQVSVTWNVDTGDWRKPGAKVITRRALAGVEPGAIVLMHDGGGSRKQTVAALPKVIHALRARGYTFTELCSPRD